MRWTISLRQFFRVPKTYVSVFMKNAFFYLETCLQILDRLAHIQLPYFIFCLLRLMIMLILTLIIHRTESTIVDQGLDRGQDEPLELVEMPELMKKPGEM